MMTRLRRFSFSLAFLGTSGLAGGFAAGSPKTTGARQEPDKAQQEKHHHDVQTQGDRVMGFSHEKTTHHFRLYADGGAIEVSANDAKDTASRDAIQSHFSHIAKMFAEGDFTAPMLTHSQNPPGADTMKRLREQIQYRLKLSPSGGRIRIFTKNTEAVKAVHDFLRFQIAEHETHDTTEVTKEAASQR